MIPNEKFSFHCPKCLSENLGYALQHPLRCCMVPACGFWFPQDDAVKVRWTRAVENTSLLPYIHLLEPGEYMRGEHGLWYFMTPNGLLGSIQEGIHTITMDEDSQIMVSPSILVRQGAVVYHGYLIHGKWQEC